MNRKEALKEVYKKKDYLASESLEVLENEIKRDIDKEIKEEKELLEEKLKEKLFEMFDAGYEKDQIQKIVFSRLHDNFFKLL